MIVAATLAAALMLHGGCSDGPEPGSDGSASAADTGPEPDAIAVAAALDAIEQYIMADDVDSASAIAMKLRDRAPRNALAREAAGRVLLMQAMAAGPGGGPVAGPMFRRAYEEYAAAVHLEPGQAGLHQSAGSVAMMAGERVRALGHFEAAGRLEPLNPQPRVFAAQLLIETGRLDEARAALERALELDPDLAVAWASLAIVAMEEADYDTARGHINEARRIDPVDPGLRAQDARIRRRAGYPRSGLDLLAGLGPLDRALLPVTTEIAACCEALGEPGRAAEAWRHRYQTSRGEPDIWRAALEAAAAYLRAGDRRQALLWVQEAALVAGEVPQITELEEAIRAAGVDAEAPG